MEKSSPTKESSKISTEIVIDDLRSIRDNLINELLKNDDSLMSYLEAHYNTIAISSLKKEFLKRDLTELRNSSLDLVHYASLIKEIKDTANLIASDLHPLFQNELKVIFQKYGFNVPQ
jgi:hypothetical protein